MTGQHTEQEATADRSRRPETRAALAVRMAQVAHRASTRGMPWRVLGDGARGRLIRGMDAVLAVLVDEGLLALPSPPVDGITRLEGRYRADAAQLRDLLHLFGRPRGGCGFCGHPDARHREADAVRRRFFAGDDPEGIVADFFAPEHQGPDAADLVGAVAGAALRADPLRLGVGLARAAELDEEVWAATAVPRDEGSAVAGPDGEETPDGGGRDDR